MSASYRLISCIGVEQFGQLMLPVCFPVLSTVKSQGLPFDRYR
jgi:hypothetical protein